MELCILSHDAYNLLIGLLNPVLAHTLQVAGQEKRRSTQMSRLHVHPAVTAATLVLLALAFVGALTATGVLA